MDSKIFFSSTVILKLITIILKVKKNNKLVFISHNLQNISKYIINNLNILKCAKIHFSYEVCVEWII